MRNMASIPQCETVRGSPETRRGLSPYLSGWPTRPHHDFTRNADCTVPRRPSRSARTEPRLRLLEPFQPLRSGQHRHVDFRRPRGLQHASRLAHRAARRHHIIHQQNRSGLQTCSGRTGKGTANVLLPGRRGGLCVLGGHLDSPQRSRLKLDVQRIRHFPSQCRGLIESARPTPPPVQRHRHDPLDSLPLQPCYTFLGEHKPQPLGKWFAGRKLDPNNRLLKLPGVRPEPNGFFKCEGPGPTRETSVGKIRVRPDRRGTLRTDRGRVRRDRRETRHAQAVPNWSRFGFRSVAEKAGIRINQPGEAANDFHKTAEHGYNLT